MTNHVIVNGYAKSFRAMKDTAGQALTQLNDEGIHWRPGGNTNTVAILIRHLSGHLSSRFSDFLTSDGEKQDRNRTGELADEAISIAALKENWEKAWSAVFTALDALCDDDLYKEKTLRGKRMTIAEYLPRVLNHTAYHTGQIVMLAKQYLGDKWHKLG